MPAPLGGRQEVSRCPYLSWQMLSTCIPSCLGPGQKRIPSLDTCSGAKGGAPWLWASGGRWAPGSQGPGGHLPPHPLTHPLSLCLPLYGEGSSWGVWGGRDKGRSPATSLPQLPEVSQVAAASSRQVRPPCGDTRDHRWWERTERGPLLLAGSLGPPAAPWRGCEGGFVPWRVWEGQGAQCGFRGLQGKNCAASPQTTALSDPHLPPVPTPPQVSPIPARLPWTEEYLGTSRCKTLQSWANRD